MDYKKEYEAMVQRARELHKGGNALTKKQMEIVCPELAESEDERIIHRIKDALMVWNDEHGLPGNVDDLLAYLEKQKEQNPAEWSKEDESNLQSCIAKIEIDMQHWDKHGKTMVDGDIKLIEWLKSLRPLKLSVDDVRLLHGLIQGVEKEATGAFTARRLPIEKYQLVLDRFLAIKNKSL